MKKSTDLFKIKEILDLRPLLFISSVSGTRTNISVYASYLPINFGKNILLESSKYKFNTSQRQNIDYLKEIKDTLMNASESGYLVLNIPFSNLLNQVNVFASPFPRMISEVDYSDVSLSYFTINNLNLPLINECLISIICKYDPKLSFNVPNSETEILSLIPEVLLIDESIDINNMLGVISSNAIFHYGSADYENRYIANINLQKIDSKNLGNIYFLHSKENFDAIDLIGTFIDKTIQELLDSNQLKEIESNLGNTYLKKYFSELKDKLIKEIIVYNECSPCKDYKPLSHFICKEDLTQETLLGYPYEIFNFQERNTSLSYPLVNVIFPCKNSSKVIEDSITFLVSEINKSRGISFNILFHVNNTIDNTTEKILGSLDKHKKSLNNIDVFILETPQKTVTSLAGSMNLCFKFFDNYLKKNNYLTRDSYMAFWDDELKDLIKTEDSLFNSNIKVLLSSKENKMISGYMIDTRKNVSLWNGISKGFSSELKCVHTKPYIHGGAGALLKWKDFPEEMISLDSVGDTDLSASLLLKIPYETLENIDYKNWPIRLNPSSPVFHPIEDNILLWTVKYIMYGISWGNSFARIKKQNPLLETLWISRKKECKSDFHREIDGLIFDLPTEKKLNREFMYHYYLVIDSLENKRKIYDFLKKFRCRSYL